MMSVKVEKLNPQELFSFWQVFAKILKHDFPGYSKIVVDYFLKQVYTKASFNYWLNTGWKTVFVAKKNSSVLGFAVLDKPYGGVCFCRWLGVLTEQRNKGIGKKLVLKWIDYAKKQGCHKVEIASQPEAKRFYEKCNLKLEGKRKLSYFGIDQYIFGKVIAKPNNIAMAKD